MAVRITVLVLKILVIFKLSFSLVAEVRAEEEFKLFESIRSMGMGGAHLITSDDELAIYANPANISKVIHPRVSVDTLTEFAFHTISPVLSVLGNMTNTSAEKNPFNLMDNDQGRYHYFSFAASPHFVAHNFQLHMLWRYQTAFIQNTATDLEIRRRIDTGLVAGFGLPLFGGVLKIGASGKLIHRADANERATDGSTYSSFSLGEFTKEGFGFGADVGVTLTAPIRFFPAIAGRWRNAGNMTFDTGYSFWSSSSPDNERPDPEESKWDVGYGMKFRMGHDSWVHLETNMRDVKGFLDDKDASSMMTAFWRHYHLGIEFSFDRIFYLRLGMYQGYPSAGLALITRIFALEFAFYGIETGTLAQRRSSYRGLLRIEFGY